MGKTRQDAITTKQYQFSPGIARLFIARIYRAPVQGSPASAAKNPILSVADIPMKISLYHALFPALLTLLLFTEPTLANKFETIGSGVAGSFHIKRESLQTGLLICGGVLLLSALLAVIVPRSNAAFLNYMNWRASALVMGLLGSALLVSYFLV
jgi:hypothetical protein